MRWQRELVVYRSQSNRRDRKRNPVKKGLAKYLKVWQSVHILEFVGHIAFIVTTQFCCCRAKATMDNI